MTLRPLRAEPCWQVNDVETGAPYEPWYEEGWPHFATREKAEKSLAEDLLRLAEDGEDNEPGDLVEVPRFVVAQSFAAPCVGLFCDGPDCSAADEPLEWGDGGWTHLDPADSQLPYDLRDIDWLEIDGKHYCPSCADAARAAADEDEDQQDRRPGPGQLELP